MKIKTKLTLGVGLLFILIILLTSVGAKYINDLKDDTENILVANYNTLEYSRNMILALDELTTNKTAFEKFDKNLIKQKSNITEIGEKEVTDLLGEHYNYLKQNASNDSIKSLIRKDISDIMMLNMQAIERKTNVAKQTATTGNTWILIAGTLCFVIAFTLLINLPNNIANPIKELTESIKQVAAKNYKQRVHFESHDEFGELAASFNSMAEKLEEYNSSSLSKLLFEKKRIETLINNMNDPVIGLDENKKVLFVNDGALKLLGLKPDEIIGKPAQDVSITNDLIRSLIKELINRPDDFQFNPIHLKPIKIFADNKESYFNKEIIDITITPTGENEKKHIGYVIVLKNITQFKELDFAKTNFIATVSHELKTPISSIKMSLELLKKEGNADKYPMQKQLIDSIQEDSDLLLKITGELLNMSQVETGNIQLNMQKCSTYEILKIAIDAVKILADQKEIELIINAGENLPDVKADSEKTAWVLINFLTNAIRYSPEQSKINISISKEADDVLFAVKDQGKGIDIRYRDKIFDRYFQVPGSIRTGTGLGLAISKEFIEAQGGRIGLNSEIGMGSTFYFELLT